jgi:hypothetical protein
VASVVSSPASPDHDRVALLGPAWRARAIFAGVLLAFLCAWISLVLGQGSYPGHVDEAHLTRHALHMLQQGDPSPHWFRYGSLPIYLTAAGMAVGALIAELCGTLRGLAEVWSVAAPYYSHAELILIPRLLFVALAVLGLACAGALGHALSRRTFALLLPIPVLAISGTYAHQAHRYLNVDIVATTLVLGSMVLLVRTLGVASLARRVLLPALLCGATIATKYNSGLVVLPFAAALLLERRYAFTAWLALGTAVSFGLFQPFALVEREQLVADLTHEIRHYQTGHPGNEADPGLPQLRYYLGVLGNDFGWLPCACGLAGIAATLRRNRRATLLVLSFPAAMFLYLSAQRVHFARTALPAIAVLGVFVALGLEVVAERMAPLLRTALSRLGSPDGDARAAGTVDARLVLGGLLLVTLGPGLFALAGQAIDPVRDSRVAVGRWLSDHAQRPCRALLPVQLKIDPVPIARACEVELVNLRSRAEADALLDGSLAPPGRTRYVVYAPFSPDGKLARTRSEAWKRVVAAARRPVLRVGSQELLLARRTPNVPDPKLEIYRLP